MIRVLQAAAACGWFALIAIIPIYYFHTNDVSWRTGVGIPLTGAAISGIMPGGLICDRRWARSPFEGLMLGATVAIVGHLICSALWAAGSSSLLDYVLRLSATFGASLLWFGGVSVPTFAFGGWSLQQVWAAMARGYGGSP